MDGEIPSKGVIQRGFRVLIMAARTEPRVFLLAAGGAILHSVLTLAGAFVLARIIDQVVVPSFASGEVETGALVLAVVVLLLLSLLKITGMVTRRLGAGSMQFRLQARYRREVTRRYLRLPVSWHHRHQTGTLLSNANADVEASFVPVAPFPFAVGTLVMLVVAMVSLLWTDWVLGMVGIGIFPLLFGFNVFYARRMSPRMTRAQQLRADVSAVGHESFDGALVVKTMGREAEETARFNKTADQLRDSLISVGRLRGLFDPIMSSLPELGTLAVLVLGAWRLSTGAVGLEEIVRVTMLFSVMAFPIRAITWVLGDLPRSVVGWERVYKVLSATGDMTYGEQRLPRDGKPAAVSFENVNFAYAADMPVLDSVSFTVPEGKTVALVGATGSGKSTITSLVSRLIDPDSGTVKVDGVDVKDLTHASLAETIALVPQLAFVFDDTIRGNIALERPEPTTKWCGVRYVRPRPTGSWPGWSPGSIPRWASEEPPCRAASGNASPWHGRWPESRAC